MIEVGQGEAPSPERQARYRWAAELVAGRRVLDAACGGGWGTARLAAGEAAAAGVDLSPAAIDVARREHGEVAEFREGDLLSLPFEDGEFDTAVCFEALAHVADPERVIDELRRVLRSDGLLLVSIPNRDVYPSGNPLHLSEIGSKELEAMLADRFASVALHRQQTYFASLLCRTELLAHGDPAAEIAVHVTKTTAGGPGSELHVVAAARDGELPPAPAWVALGEDVAYEERRAQLEEWQERAIQAEAKALALERELRDLQS
jgi:SAM-dependent methyltransferase